MAKFVRAKDCVNCPYKSSAFKFLSVKEIKHIQNNCLTVNFKKGENVCKQHLKVTHALFLSSGLVKMFIETERKNSILSITKGGQYIGLMSVFAGDNYNFSVTALEPSKVCMVDVNTFKEMARSNAAFGTEITKIISECTDRVLKRISFCNGKSVRVKLAQTLLWFADKIYKNERYRLSISRQELAELIGVSRENAVRILSEFKKDGIIDTDGKVVHILQRDILDAMANTN